MLLAEKSGWISIVASMKSTPSYLVVSFPSEKTKKKLFNAERGKRWELFNDMNEAIEWIESRNEITTEGQ